MQHSIKAKKRHLPEEIVKYEQIRQKIADPYVFLPKLQAKALVSVLLSASNHHWLLKERLDSSPS